MNNRRRLAALAIPLLWIMCATGHSVGGHSAGDSPNPRPNILFIYIDDLGWNDVSFNGHSKYQTPRIDSLARGGLVFSSAYANAPNCAPSRACLMSGQYSPRHGIYTVGNPRRGNKQLRKIEPTPNETVLPPSPPSCAVPIGSLKNTSRS